MKKDLLCLVHAPVSTVSGYGKHSVDIIRSLIKAYPDWDIKILDTNWGNTPRNALKKNKDDDIINKIINQKLSRQPDVYIPILIPNEFKQIGKYNIGITAGIESDKADPSWIDGLNKMDLNIVPSIHSKNVFENTSYDRKDEKTGNVVDKLVNQSKIEVLFEGVNTDIYKQTEKIDSNLNNLLNNKIKESFVFLFVGHWIEGALGHDRKDVGMLIKVFCETFKNMADKPALLLKTSGANFSIEDREKIIKKIKSLRKDNKELPNVYLLHGELTDSEMNGLYNHKKIKSMVSFTHGEGYGRPLAEFSLSKKPIIAPNWSGQVDFLNKDYCSLLEGELKQVHRSVVRKNIIVPDSKWFYVNYFIASQTLKDVYRNYNMYKEKAKKQSKYVWDNFTLNKMTERLKSIIDENIPEFPEEVELMLPKLKPIKGESSE